MANFATEPKSDSQNSQKVVKVIGVVAIAASVAFCGYRAWACIGDYQQHMANMNAFSVEQDKYDKQAQNAAVSVPVEASDVKDYVGKANKAGKELAKLETGYQTLTTDQISDYAEKQVGAYFTKDGQRDRVPWCERLQVPYTWEFLSAYEFKDGVVPCVFKCTVEDDVLVAYAYASFDPESGLFSNVDRSYTSVIQKYQLAEGVSPTSTSSSSSSDTASSANSTESNGSSGNSASAASGGNPSDNPPSTAAAGNPNDNPPSTASAGNPNDNPPSTTSSSSTANRGAGE